LRAETKLGDKVSTGKRATKWWNRTNCRNRMHRRYTAIRWVLSNAETRAALPESFSGKNRNETNPDDRFHEALSRLKDTSKPPQLGNC
ncbi:MAG: hypothetical protein DMG59_25225, partial [Acidobacteria bacterium]